MRRRAPATALLGVALTAAGLLFALPSLYVAGIALPLLALLAAAWVRLAARAARIELAATPRRVEEGGRVTVVARAALRRLSPAAELHVAGTAPVAVSRAAPEAVAHARFDRRGVRALGPAMLAFGDPLGLATRSVASGHADVLVLPRLEPVQAAGRGRLEGAGTPARLATGPELELDSLRPHRPGAPASRIHWPTAARTGELIERHLVADADSRPLVVLDAARPAGEEALDRAVRAAASLCHALALGGGCRVLLPGDRRATAIGPDLRSWPAVHERLALVEPARRPPRLPRGIASSGLYWVAAAHRAAPRELELAADTERYLVAPGAAAGAAFTVGGCSGTALARRRPRAA